MEMDLGIMVSEKDEFRIINLSGELDAYTSARFRDVLVQSIDGGRVNILCEMTEVEYIDSSGLGALVGGLKRASERDGRIYIVAQNPLIRKIFEITSLDHVFEVWSSTIDEAIAELRARATP